MKIFRIAIVLVVFSLSFIFAQGMPPGGFNNNFEKIEQMENARLIQVLNLNEASSVRFFARRKEFRQKQRSLLEKRFELMNQVDELVKGNEKDNSKIYKDKLDKIISIDLDLIRENKDFYKSLNNILTAKQVLKLLLFEDRFRREVRETLIKRNRGGRP